MPVGANLSRFCQNIESSLHIPLSIVTAGHKPNGAQFVCCRLEGGVFKPRFSATLKTKVRLLFDAGKAVSRTKYPSEFLQSD